MKPVHIMRWSCSQQSSFVLARNIRCLAQVDQSLAEKATSTPLLSDHLSSLVSDKSLLRTECMVGGEWTAAADGRTLEVHNPATGDVVARVPFLGANETRAAIAEASTSFPKWAAKTGKERAMVLQRWHDVIMEAQDDITTIMTVECGKPKAEAKAEFAAGVASVQWFAEEAKRICGDDLASTVPGRRMQIWRQPVGVVVLKPSELTPLTALALAALAEKAGVPSGVLSVLCGDAPAIGKQLLDSTDVRKIGFTGSTPVGKQLMSGAASTVKRVSLELGGNAPFIVFEDADLEAAAKAVIISSFRNAGQTCICTNRVFVQDQVYDAFAQLVVDNVRKLKVGSGLDPATTLGPVITPQSIEKIQGRVSDAVGKGAQVAIGGEVTTFSDTSPFRKGNFFDPTVLTNATIDMRVFREEMFGPVVPLFRFHHDSEAVQLANDTEYGLAAYFFTKDLSRAFRVAEQLDYGMVGVNEVAIGSEVAPFGGMKQSGLGREQSKYGLDEFLEMKYVCFNVS